jgi:tRNA (guanine37-N1)-methyltransferase
MRFDIFTLFPQMFQGPFTESILKRAVEAGLLELHVHDIRAYATDKHRVCDDYPYGGGAGMVMKPEPVFAAVESVLGPEVRNVDGGGSSGTPDAPDSAPVPVILLTPQGRLFTQEVARELARQPRLALICGHYEGVDERIRQHLVTDEISLGDYVLTGGELPAMVVVDAVARLAPGVLDGESTVQEAPDMLLSGHHGRIAAWRRQQSLLRTLRRRPDLLAKAPLTERDHAFLKSLEMEEVTD